ncbi:MAG: Folylpolyglutamate synthetase [Claussenomyces sp. TS43310]|nr:MAG: Folylpolyglutamate synthetase [Claussenomyces sp. TS43310]
MQKPPLNLGMKYVQYKAFRIGEKAAWSAIQSSTFSSGRRSFAVMASRTYDDAVDALNTLQTDFRVLQERREAGIRPDETSIVEMRGWFQRIGYEDQSSRQKLTELEINDLDRLNIVHVAGTKGKGTTCAYVDSILSHYHRSRGIPKKTGLFTSPHLVSVRERIRINSEPISSKLFAKYFFEVWDLLESSARTLSLDPKDKPVYFRYLTLMSFHVFLREGVDAAVYEVGVGGAFDATNMIEGPAATGISALGIDHVYELGDTVDKIAWHKAGIMKTGSPAFTVKQVPDAAVALEKRAHEKGADLKVVDVNPALKNVKVMPDAEFQRTNASLAIALASKVLQKLDGSSLLPGDSLPREFVDGLEQVVWRGRCEIKVEGNIRWYLDGAHTEDSLRVAAEWFGVQSSQEPGTRVLIFNQQGRASAVTLLEGLFRALELQGLVNFDHVVFCTNVTYAQTGYKKDFVNHTYDAKVIAGLTVQKSFAEKWTSLDPSAKVSVAPSIEQALDYVKNLAKAHDEDHVQAFITGSLHLVGGALGVLEGADAL